MILVDKLLKSLGIDSGVIELPARGGTRNYLEPTEEEGRYKLVAEHDNIRIIGECDAIDPVDGPFMAIGYEVSLGLRVNKIEVGDDGIYLTLV